MHIDLKAYLGIVNDLQLESTKKYRNEYDALIKKNIVDSNDIDLQIYFLYSYLNIVTLEGYYNYLFRLHLGST